MKIFIVVGQSQISNFIVKAFSTFEDAEDHILELSSMPETFNKEWYIEEHELHPSSSLLSTEA